VGKLVQFEGKGKGHNGRRPDASASAEILIFTGVRYERQNSDAPTKPTATSSGAKRKRG
jgi:hypothetical protein